MWVFIVLGILVFIGITIAIVVGISSSSNSGYEPRTRTDYDRLEINQVGKAGENYVASYLSGLASTYNGYLFNDYCFEDEEGFSTEIDHILITRGGVFVVETKTNKGIIYGNKEDDYWECIKKEYQDDKILNNPLIQNQGHINHLRRMFGRNAPKMQSIIIFPIADISNLDIDNVYDINAAMAAIKELTIQAKYSQDFVNIINNQLKSIKDRYGISKERHIQNIHRIYH